MKLKLSTSLYTILLFIVSKTYSTDAQTSISNVKISETKSINESAARLRISAFPIVK